mgnify:CR=1 FL=1|tara:strand:- start:4905 stop:7169 length:2265 start_codon:yes stop_codon:yes gene_type:complete
MTSMKDSPWLRALRESFLWLNIGLSIIFFIALASYDKTDAAFSISGTGQLISNKIGPFGAWVADLSFMLFGYPAYLFPVLISLVGYLRYKSKSIPVDSVFFLWRSIGFLSLLFSSCGLASLHFFTLALRETAGGIIGQLVGQNLEVLLGILGSTLLLLVIWLVSISLFTGVSWLTVIDKLGSFILRSIYYFNQIFSRLQVFIQGYQAKKKRKESIAKDKLKKSYAKKVKIEPSIEGVELSDRSHKEKQVPLFEPIANAEMPELSLLDDPPEAKGGYSQDSLEAMSRLVELKLDDFGIDAEVISVQPGPVVTRFEIKPAAGVKVNQIANLSKDLARSLSTISVRVVDVIPGKPYIGIEIPNEERQLVVLGEIIKSKTYDSMGSTLTLALGKDIGGQPVVADLAKMPHLLIAGTTGSGKSVAINAMILSLLYKSPPEQVRLIMIDPKMLELSVYEGIPHLLSPVVTDMKQAANALRWCVSEMDRRYALMAHLGVRHISGYNNKVRESIDNGHPIEDPFFKQTEDNSLEKRNLEPLPEIVVIVDELADMMMLVGKKVEQLIARLAQKARASGIYMIIATQRPSVDVITGLIKANIPSRIAFQVSAKVDSRTILDQGGAEQLLGHGDMLYLPPGVAVPTRVHGAFVSDEEVHSVVDSLKKSGPPKFIDEILEDKVESSSFESGSASESDGERDPLYDEAVSIVIKTQKASISGVQRRLKIGYNRAARMVETMEEAGIVSKLESNGSRDVLVPPRSEED